MDESTEQVDTQDREDSKEEQSQEQYVSKLEE
jgi:hypothetical protein